MHNNKNINLNEKNSFSKFETVHAESDEKINEISPTMKAILNEGITDNSKPRELWISCDAINKKNAKALKRSLKLVIGFSVFPLFKLNKMWVVNGLKMIQFHELESEINSINETVKLHSCELVDWHVQVDKIKNRILD